MPDTNNSITNTVAIGKQKILSADISQIGKSFIEDMFASYHDKATNKYQPAPFDPTMSFNLSSSEYKWVKGQIVTDLGTLIFNRYLLERTGLIDHIGYWNQVINKKNLEKLNDVVSNLVLTDDITTKDLGNYIDSRDCLGFWCSAFLGSAVTPGLIRPMADVKKRKDELFKQYQDQLNSDNTVTQIKASSAIENELLGMVKKNMQNDPGWDMYASGVNNFDNNYKTINVMRGAVFDNAIKRYHVVDSSLMEGIKPRDITPFSNSNVAAAYPSAVGTAEAGYMSKQLIALLQSEHISQDENSDCGTQSTIPITVTNKNKQYLIFRNIKEGNKIKQTTLHNIEEYVGKTIHMYSPQCCCGKTICAKCAGRLFYDMAGGKVVNIGMLMPVITKKILDLKLKSKHDLSQNAGFMEASKTFAAHTDFVDVTEDGYLRTKRPLKLYAPKYNDEVTAYYIEATTMHCMGMMPAKFFDEHGNELASTLMTVPTMIDLNIYGDLQEDVDNYILSYEAGALVCSLAFAQNIANVCQYLDLIFLHSKLPLVPYHLYTDMTFRNLELNKIDLTGPSMVYELLARRLCRSGRESYASVYGRNQNADPLGYTKLAYREAVQQAGAIQAMMFEDISKGINVNLANTLNGHEPEDTPFDMIIRA